MDNLNSNHRNEAKEIIESVGARVRVIDCSPKDVENRNKA